MDSSQQEALSKAWQQYAVAFRQAEYAVKICEHLSAGISESALIALANSGKYAVAALKEEGNANVAVKRLSRACVCVRQAHRLALFHGMLLLYERVDAIVSRYPEKHHDMVKEKIPEWDVYLAHLDELRVLVMNCAEEKSLRLNRNFIANSQKMIDSLMQLVDAHAAVAEDLEDSIQKHCRSEYEATWGKLMTAFFCLIVSVLLSALWGGRAALMEILRAMF